MITTADAVNSLRPNTEWSMTGDDVEKIIWHTDGVKPLTQAEVVAEMARLENESAQKATDRAEGLRKMAQASGLTEAELAALGL